jgi:magnesium transporter
MPELKTRNGYFLVIGVMAVLTLVLLVYFWRRGWIFQKDDPIALERKTTGD